MSCVRDARDSHTGRRSVRSSGDTGDDTDCSRRTRRAATDSRLEPRGGRNAEFERGDSPVNRGDAAPERGDRAPTFGDRASCGNTPGCEGGGDCMPEGALGRGDNAAWRGDSAAWRGDSNPERDDIPPGRSASIPGRGVKRLGRGKSADGRDNTTSEGAGCAEESVALSLERWESCSPCGVCLFSGIIPADKSVEPRGDADFWCGGRPSDFASCDGGLESPLESDSTRNGERASVFRGRGACRTEEFAFSAKSSRSALARSSSCCAMRKTALCGALSSYCRISEEASGAGETACAVLVEVARREALPFSMELAYVYLSSYDSLKCLSGSSQGFPVTFSHVNVDGSWRCLQATGVQSRSDDTVFLEWSHRLNVAHAMK